ncbi:YbjN domain-containing protein [Roseinatronobacter alkalisoli]|uniref:YbjN domain-containing protein n=1 Tax=Roseinatronobacter alkalisoli TaxID=3028235 RepID=A0ABT5TC40_9RHOB|nr:YbjN domain-containing protein [Roseinatronobacter sp. HJB301]MDD7971493.1 YbjN domain-containing protein [Roseinatronobacter sp. HJB301]
MSATEFYLSTDPIHPIDIVETLADHNDWDFDRMAEDQIAMVVEGQWRSYALTLALSPDEDMLRLICTFDMDPPDAALPAVYETINRANDMVWSGAFSFWASQRLMVWRYGLLLGQDQTAEMDQIDRMIRTAITAAERFYPAFQLVAWADHSPKSALDLALSEAVGHA